MLILAFESSCDETAAAVVRDGREVLSDAVASQADMHAVYGGVVPEIASRKHVEAIAALTEKALADAGGLEAEDSLEKEEGLLVRDGALPDFFSQMPEQFTCPDCGAALSVAADGAFSGTLADGTRFSGVFSELEEAGICVYTAAASSVSLEAVPEGTSFRLEEGAAFLIYLPGADVQSLPEAFSGFDGQDTPPCWGVYFPAEEMAFTCSPP